MWDLLTIIILSMLFIGTISFLQDDCCDRSIESEVSTLHSQDEMMSEEHNKELDESARITDMKSSGAKGSLRHTTSDSSSLNGRDCSRGMFRVLSSLLNFSWVMWNSYLIYFVLLPSLSLFVCCRCNRSWLQFSSPKIPSGCFAARQWTFDRRWWRTIAISGRPMDTWICWPWKRRWLEQQVRWLTLVC